MRHDLPRFEKTFQPRRPNALSLGLDRLRPKQRQRVKYGAIVAVVVFLYFILFSSSIDMPEISLLRSDSRASVMSSAFMSRLQRNTKTRYNEDYNFEYFDLADFEGHGDGAARQEYILLCIPLRNAATVLPMMFSHLFNLTYPHNLIDIAFLISDTDDSTVEDLYTFKHSYAQSMPDSQFNSVTIMEKDFGQIVGQGFDDRHGVAVQGQRRKLMGRARNWLLSANLKPYHSWVYWRDADIETSPATIIEDLMKHNVDVIVPNVWRPLPDWLGGEQPYDLNAWQESTAALNLAKTLHEDDVIVEGYAEYTTWRPHMAYFRSENGNQDELMDLDGIGGVSILAKASVFRRGANFPGFALWNHAETEAFGKMCRKMGFRVVGKVHYTVWHQYEPSEDDLKQMKQMELDAKLAHVSQVVEDEGKI